MERFAEGVWLDTEPIRIAGTHLSVNMAVLRLPNDGLVLYSPLVMTPQRREAVEALGPVEHLFAPNLWHHLHIGEWAAAFPNARVHAPAGLEKKRPDLRIDRRHTAEQEPDFEEVIDEHVISGFRMFETGLYYRPAQTLIVADLVHNVGRPKGWWTETYTKLAGFYDRVALSRVLQWTAFSDKNEARQSLDRMLDEPFDKLVVGHGAPVESGAREAFEHAYEWMPRPRVKSLPATGA